jgi:hypothetical protein
MADDSPLIALTNVYPGKRSAVLRSVPRKCASNRAFGDNGAGATTTNVAAHAS